MSSPLLWAGNAAKFLKSILQFPDSTAEIQITGNNMDLTGDAINLAASSVTVNSNDIVTIDATQTLTNKTLTVPIINNGVIESDNNQYVSVIATAAPADTCNMNLQASDAVGIAGFTVIKDSSGKTGNALLTINKFADTTEFAITADSLTLNGNTVVDNGISELTGDVTATGPGSVAATIANDAVTYAKMQEVSAASRLLGRGDSGSGNPEEITLGTNLSMSGTTLNATSSSSLSVVSKTANYTIDNADGLILVDASGGAFNLTLPGSPATGQQHYIERTDDTPTNAVSLVGTIEGASDWQLNTKSEAYEIVYTGSAWKILNHKTTYIWASTTVPITAASGGLVKGNTTGGVDSAIARREGDLLKYHCEYRQPAVGSGANGTGAYLITLPNSLTIDSNKLPSATYNFDSNNFLGTLVVSNGSNTYLAWAYVLNSTQFRFDILSAGVGSAWTAAGLGIFTSAGSAFSFDVEIPITGWKV